MTFVEFFFLKKIYLNSVWQESGILRTTPEVNKTDDFADGAPLSLAPCKLTMLFSSRSGCEKGHPIGKAFPTGRLRVSSIVATVLLLPHGPDWCVPALFSWRIIGIIEWHVVLRAKPKSNGSIVWAILPFGC